MQDFQDEDYAFEEDDISYLLSKIIKNGDNN